MSIQELRIILLELNIAMAVILPLLFILYTHRKAMKRKSIQEEILKTNSNLLSQGRWFPVKYCSEARFHKWLKFSYWDATGILFIGNNQIIFLYSISSQKNLKQEFDPKTSTVEWIGGKALTNMGFSWLTIDFQGKKHYFTSDTETIFGSKTKTQEIYDELSRILNSAKMEIGVVFDYKNQGS